MFDYDISQNVPLHRILDELIESNENPSIVVDFIKLHNDSFCKILESSLHGMKIFQLDFFFKCNDAEKEFILGKAFQLMKNYVNDMHNSEMLAVNSKLFCWQILSSNSGILQYCKHKYRQAIDCIVNADSKKHISIRHPYAFGHSRYIEEFDNLCFNAAKTGKIQNIPYHVDNNLLQIHFKHLCYSLFQNRIMQHDFFINLSDAAKFMMLNDISTMQSCQQQMNFTLQVLDSDVLDVEVKKHCCKLVNGYGVDLLFNKDTVALFNECDSFSEMLIKSSIFNIEVTPLAMLWLLMNKEKWLKEWRDQDPDDLDMHLNISDLVDSIH